MQKSSHDLRSQTASKECTASLRLHHRSQDIIESMPGRRVGRKLERFVPTCSCWRTWRGRITVFGRHSHCLRKIHNNLRDLFKKPSVSLGFFLMQACSRPHFPQRPTVQLYKFRHETERVKDESEWLTYNALIFSSLKFSLINIHNHQWQSSWIFISPDYSDPLSIRTALLKDQSHVEYFKQSLTSSFTLGAALIEVTWDHAALSFKLCDLLK